MARAYLAGSTYLSDNLRDVLAAWSVCRFIISESDGESCELRDAFRKYYLYETETLGGTEYAIADHLLGYSELYDPVILGKSPLVIEFLANEIPAFQRAIPRALGNLRHAGDSFSRLFSAMGIWENSEYGEMFYRWLYGPGIPQLEVSWSDTSGVLYVWVEQYQPGQVFPLGSVLDTVRLYTAIGWHDIDLSQGPTAGFFTADISGIIERPVRISIDPESILPADIIYRHSTGVSDEI
jgi:hypothetical protein